MGCDIHGSDRPGESTAESGTDAGPGRLRGRPDTARARPATTRTLPRLDDESRHVRPRSNVAVVRGLERELTHSRFPATDAPARVLVGRDCDSDWGATGVLRGSSLEHDVGLLCVVRRYRLACDAELLARDYAVGCVEHLTAGVWVPVELGDAVYRDRLHLGESRYVSNLDGRRVPRGNKEGAASGGCAGVGVDGQRDANRTNGDARGSQREVHRLCEGKRCLRPRTGLETHLPERTDPTHTDYYQRGVSPHRWVGTGRDCLRYQRSRVAVLPGGYSG